MEAGNVIALAAAALAAIVAVWVPWLAFRFAIRQEQSRWLRERRAELYVDLLTEAYAEQQHLEYGILDDERRLIARYDDLRLPPMERAVLGTRANIYGSREVNRLFMKIQTHAIWATVPRGPQAENERIKIRMEAGRHLEALQNAIRQELGPDRIPLHVDRRIQ